jgi:hypothetical protein
MIDEHKNIFKKPTIVTKKMKEYEKEIINKLPNELRWALKDYNYHDNNYYYSNDNEDYNFD